MEQTAVIECVLLKLTEFTYLERSPMVLGGSSEAYWTGPHWILQSNQRTGRRRDRVQWYAWVWRKVLFLSVAMAHKLRLTKKKECVLNGTVWMDKCRWQKFTAFTEISGQRWSPAITIFLAFGHLFRVCSWFTWAWKFMSIHVIFDCAVVVTIKSIKTTITILLGSFVDFRYHFCLFFTQRSGADALTIVVIVHGIGCLVCIFLFVWPDKMNWNTNGLGWPEWTLARWNWRQRWHRHWRRWNHWLLCYWRWNSWQRWAFFFIVCRTIHGHEEWICWWNWHGRPHILYWWWHCWLSILLGSGYSKPNVLFWSCDRWTNTLFGGHRHQPNIFFGRCGLWSNFLFGSRLDGVFPWWHPIASMNNFILLPMVFQWLMICIFCTFNDGFFYTLILMEGIA